jgi:4-aminobutyrate aminotransferase
LMEEHPIIGDVRGLGLMQATEFVLDRRTKEPAVKARDEIELLAFKRGLIILGCGRSAMRYIPPLTISEKMIDAGIEVLDGVIRDVSLDTGVG